ncbi:hypothetical protein ACTNBL_01065 [Enterococcus villorum]|uniref:hypothetical protein n=1 Tax=Enterococcus villorum TaxID=112904 RepID=UPI003F8ACC38
MRTTEAKDFERRIDMLALTLSLKWKNEKCFDNSEGYHLLFSTYIEMIKNDNDHFFVEKEKKDPILRSLKRTIDLYSFKDASTIEECLHKMRSDEPTDFMIYPCNFVAKIDPTGKKGGHRVGLIIYKKRNHFVVVKVDKEKYFDGNQLSYLEFSNEKIGKLSQLLFLRRDDQPAEMYLILKKLINCSQNDHFVPISTKMKRQKTGTCAVSEIEASLKVALFNCQKNLFSLDKGEKLLPNWNSKYTKATLEMRKRFLSAMKGDNQDWNQHFDYVFNCYVHKDKTYDSQTRQKLFGLDLYIPEMFMNKGKILNQEESSSLEKINEPSIFIQAKYSIYADDKKLKMITNDDLKDELSQLESYLKILEERLPFVTIERAKNLFQQEQKFLQDRIEIYQTEIKSRQEIQLKSKKETQESLITTKNVGLNQKKNREQLSPQKVTTASKKFVEKIDMLAFTLSLKKENEQSFHTSEAYQLLFSIYVEMIKNDKDHFFVEKGKKESIILSLERTINFYNFKDMHTPHGYLDRMKTDDPTDFAIFPCKFMAKVDGFCKPNLSTHLSGLIIYKKENHFIVMKVDKQSDHQLSYLEIPKENMAGLSQFLFFGRNFLHCEESLVLKKLVQLSKNDHFIPISAEMEKQKAGNHSVSALETSSKVALFNCQKDLFSLDKDEKIRPYWNLKYAKDTLEMRKRFLTAMKRDDPKWNRHFDYIFSCYAHKDKTYDHETRQKLYGKDLYISEMFMNTEKILSQKKTNSLEKINEPSIFIQAKYRMYADDKKLKVMADTNLKDELSQLENHLKILNGRLPFINIKKAKKILQQEKKYLKKCRKNHQAEIKRRQEIQLENKNETQESLIIQKDVVLNQKEKSEQQSFKRVEVRPKENQQERQQKMGQRSFLAIQQRSEKKQNTACCSGLSKRLLSMFSKNEHRNIQFQQERKRMEDLSKKIHAEIQQKKKQKNLLTIQHR